jgi:hypothetical protein
MTQCLISVARAAGQIEARALSRRLLEGDESVNLERKVVEAQRLLELLKHGRIGVGIKKHARVRSFATKPKLVALCLGFKP